MRRGLAPLRLDFVRLIPLRFQYFLACKHFGPHFPIRAAVTIFCHAVDSPALTIEIRLDVAHNDHALAHAHILVGGVAYCFSQIQLMVLCLIGRAQFLWTPHLD